MSRDVACYQAGYEDGRNNALREVLKLIKEDKYDDDAWADSGREGPPDQKILNAHDFAAKIQARVDEVLKIIKEQTDE